MDLIELRALIDQTQRVMIDVATHQAAINDEDVNYIERKRRIASELRRLGLEDPNPQSDLWQWYSYWKDNFPSYAERRTYVRSLYASVLDALDHLEERELGAGIGAGETGWERVDSQIRQLRERFATARTTEDYQAVGHLSREVFVSLAEACFVAGRHAENGEVPAGVKDRLARVVAVEAGGGEFKELRKTINSNIDLANAVQHDRSTTVDEAAIIAEATIASANMLRYLIIGATRIGAAEPLEEAAEPDFPFEPDDDFPF
jgi:hypothetical protein